MENDQHGNDKTLGGCLMLEFSKEIKNWKNSFRGQCSLTDLEELEAHLLELVEDLRETGLSDQEAFKQAVARIGDPKDIGREFAKARSVGDWMLDRFKALDLPLILALVLICGMGLGAIHSAGGRINTGLWIKQAVWTGIGFGLMFLVAQVNPARLKRWAPFIYGASLFFLLLLPFAGFQALGTRKWLSLGAVNILPSVFMLVTIPMMTSSLLAKHEWASTRKGFATILALILAPTVLVLFQPDLGMALLCLCAGWITMYFSDCRARLVKFTCFALPVLFVAGWLMRKPYQIYQLQELAPIAQGNHTDFIFTSIAQQFGTSGVMLLLACFGFLFYRAITIGNRSMDSFSRSLGLGFAGVALLMPALKIGTVYGWMPPLGLALPLVSYGGSSTILFLVGFGILSSIQRQQQLCQ